jgi:hypothetical protein
MKKMWKVFRHGFSFQNEGCKYWGHRTQDRNEHHTGISGRCHQLICQKTI